MARRRRFGSVRRLPSGRYQARYVDLAGRQHAAPETFASKTEADRWLSGVETDLTRGDWIDPKAGRTTFAVWAADYLANSSYKRESTRVQNRTAVKHHLIPAFGHFPLVAMTPLDIRRFVEQLSASGLAPSTIRSIVGQLRTILNAAIDAELLKSNPCRRVKLPPKSKTKITLVTPEQLDTISAHLDIAYQPMIYLAGVLGMRWSEITGLRVGRLDLLRRKLSVEETAAGTGGFADVKTPASRRTLTLPTFVADMLAEHLARQGLDASNPDALVFTGERGGRLWAANFHKRHWTPALQAAGFPELTFHALRHASVALAIEQGAHPHQIQERLGHSSIVTTFDVYGHILTTSDELLDDRLDQRFRSAPNDVGRT